MRAGNLYHIFIKFFYGLSSVCCLQIYFYLSRTLHILFVHLHFWLLVFVKTNWDLKCSTILSMYFPWYVFCGFDWCETIKIPAFPWTGFILWQLCFLQVVQMGYFIHIADVSHQNNDCWFVISLAGCGFPTEELNILLTVALSSKCLIHVIRLVALTEIFLIQQQWLRITSKQFLRENVSFFWLPLMNGLFKLLYSHVFKIHF